MSDAIRVLSTLALKGAVLSLAGQYQAAGGAHIDADFAPTLALLKRLRAGETADVVILTREGLDEIAREGRVAVESCVDLARSWVGIAVKAGEPHPDIATEAALRAALLGARSVAYSRRGGWADSIPTANARRVFRGANGGDEQAGRGRPVAAVSRVARGRAGVARERAGALNFTP